MKRFVITHLCALNDTNGNPRRIYAVADLSTMGDGNGNCTTMSYYDQGYSGFAAVPEWIRDDAAWMPSFDITPKEYRCLLSRSKGKAS